jgi:hypothetical protein
MWRSWWATAMRRDFSRTFLAPRLKVRRPDHAVAGHRPDAVHLLDAGHDLRDVDAESGKGVGLGLREPGPSACVAQSLP